MTDDITTCHVKNKHDNLFITLFTEWLDSGLKITIFGENAISLTGQMAQTDVEEFAKNLSKSYSDYVALTRRILSGKDDGVEFILKDSKFRWKKGPWIHGIIQMTEARMERVFPDVVKKILLRHTELEKTVEVIKGENEKLTSAKMELNDKIEGIIATKNELEDNLYKRFIIVLNSKKEKIRELQNVINKRNGGVKKQDEKIYEAETDQSEEEEEEQQKQQKQKESDKGSVLEDDKPKKTKKSEEEIESSLFLSRAFSNVEIFGGERLLKRQMSDSEGKMIDSEYEEEDRIKKNCKYAKGGGRNESPSKGKNKVSRGKGTPTKMRESTPSKASTSRNILEFDRGDKTKKNVKSALNFDSGESDEDMFADN